MLPLLAADQLCKRFYATQALDHVSFDVRAGEVHALMGENGAGKSTLIKMLGGVYRPDAGSMRLDGKVLSLASPADALAQGIGVIPQELRVVPALSVAENVMLGHLPRRGWLHRVDRARMREAARDALARLNVHLDLDRRLGALSFAERQSVVIARALSRNVRILVLDEPTAALEGREVDSLMRVIERLKADGVGMVYVSHRLDEVLALADRCTVMRDGKVIAQLRRGEFSAGDLVRHMTGRDVEIEHARQDKTAGEVLLETHEDASFTLRASDITGLAGLLGSGASDLIRRVFGAGRAGRIIMRGRPIDVAHPGQAVRAGLGLVPNERALGLVLSHTVRDNIVLANLKRFGTLWRLDHAAVDRIVAELIKALDIRPADPHAVVRSLSGGNQQKVVIAKWLAAQIDVLLMDEPTQGVDVAAKAHIHRLMQEFAGKGGAVLFASSDTHELLSLADSVLAMRGGRITAHITRGQGLTEHAVRTAIGG